jgi:carboxyl-terminal processing protease
MDGTTTGAAEVLAAAIANTKRGDLVGDRTFGLASEQKLIPLDDGAAIILTVGNYMNADGKSILDEGVAPTEVVRSASTGEGDDGEEAEATGTAKEPPPAPRPLSADDPVLQKALQLLKTPAKKAA